MNKDAGTIDSDEVRGKVLIVDDSPETVKFLDTMLTREGYTVRKASNGPEAHTDWRHRCRI